MTGDRLDFEKQSRLLTQPLSANWPGPGEGRTFLVMANAGWYYQTKKPAVVLDCLLSLDVMGPENVPIKRSRSYYQWETGKQPDVVIEFVTARTGGEESFKKQHSARLGVPHYAVFDPLRLLSEDTLRTYELVAARYWPGDPGPWPGIGLGLRVWEGMFEGVRAIWLRWCDANGEIVPTEKERFSQADEPVLL